MRYKQKSVITVFVLMLLSACNQPPPMAEAERSQQHAESSVLAAAISEDGKISIVSAEGRFQVSGEAQDYQIIRDDLEGVKVWDNQANQLLHNFFHSEAPNQVKALAVSANNEYFATAEKGSVKLWDMQTLETLGYWQFESQIRKLALSRTGRYLIIATQTGQIAHVDTVTERQLVYLGHGNDQNNGQINSISVTPSGRFVLSGGIDKTAQLWDGESGQTMQTFQHPTRVSTVTMDDSAKLAFTSDVIKNHQVWNVRTGELVQALDITERFSWFSAATFNHDASLLATGSPNQEIKLWQVSTGKLLARWKTQPLTTILDVKFSGNYLVTENSKGLAEWWKLPDIAEPTH